MYSITIWSADPAAEEPQVPAVAGFEVTHTGWVKKSPEQIPADLYLNVPGLCAACTVTVSPDPGPAICRRMEAFAQKLAIWANGAALLPPEKEEEEPRVCCARKRTYPVVTEYAARMTLGLWFPGGAGVRALRPALVSVLQTILPPALPVRYGAQNPPDKVLESTSSPADFTGFLSGCDTPVWFPAAPFGNVFLRDNARGEKDRCGYFSLTVSAAVWQMPEWREALQRCLWELCTLYGAFFGQVTADVPGVAPGRWQGIPEDLGEVCYLGAPYRKNISAEGAVKESDDGLLFADPVAPVLPKEYISFRKKLLFGHAKGESRGFALPGDFKPAADLPAACFACR